MCWREEIQNSRYPQTNLKWCILFGCGSGCGTYGPNYLIVQFLTSCLWCLFYRLVFSRSQHHVTAEVFSSSSPIPVLTCSTQEWAVKRELYSTSCVAACQAVGEVMAQRCQQAGITRMVYQEIPWTYRADGVSTMQQGLLKSFFKSSPALCFSLSCRFSHSGLHWKQEESSLVNPEGNTSGPDVNCHL